MLLTQAHTIVQVLERFWHGDVEVHDHIWKEEDYRQGRWKGSLENKKDSELEAPEVALWFGKYDYPPVRPGGNDRFEDRSASLVILNVGGQTPLRSIDSSRLVGSLEYAPLGLIANIPSIRDRIVQRPSPVCKRLCNTGVLLGFHAIHDERFNAHGPGIRFVKVYPAVDLQFSTYFNTLRYNHRGGEYRHSFGGRIDLGFSAASFFLQFGREHFINRANRLESTPMFTAGFGFGLPTARIGKYIEGKDYAVQYPKPPESVSTLEQTPPPTR